MKVAIVLHGEFPVTGYGGTQRVVWALAKALFQLKHHVIVMADRVGECPFAETVLINRSRAFSKQIPDDVDIVHLNGMHAGMEQISKPYVITIHGNRDISETTPNMIFVSRDHARRHGSESYVYNGLDWDMFPDVDLSKERRWFHFLGNAAWRVKNVRGAIDVITHTRSERLHVLGGSRLNFRMGFRFTLSPRVHFHGMVNDAEKQQVMSRSKGLVFPVTWHEPFGLAIIESLYFGCPVYGTPYGSLPELITSDVGVLSNSRQQLSDAIMYGDSFSQVRCHEYARDLFSSHAMAKAYLEKYHKVMNGEALSRISVRSHEAFRDLPWYH